MPILYIQLYYSSNAIFTEGESFKQTIEGKIDSTFQFTFELPKKQISHLRINPISERWIITFHKLVVYSQDGEIIELKPSFHNALFVNEKDYYFETHEPQIYFKIPKRKRAKNWT